MASRVTKRDAPSSGALEAAELNAPFSVPRRRAPARLARPPPAEQLLAPAASGATGTGFDPEPEPTPEPASVPRWEPPPDIADIEQGAEEAMRKVETVEEVEAVEEVEVAEEVGAAEEAVADNKQPTCSTAPPYQTHSLHPHYTP